MAQSLKLSYNFSEGERLAKAFSAMLQKIRELQNKNVEKKDAATNPCYLSDELSENNGLTATHIEPRLLQVQLAYCKHLLKTRYHQRHFKNAGTNTDNQPVTIKHKQPPAPDDLDTVPVKLNSKNTSEKDISSNSSENFKSENHFEEIASSTTSSTPYFDNITMKYPFKETVMNRKMTRDKSTMTEEKYTKNYNRRVLDKKPASKIKTKTAIREEKQTTKKSKPVQDAAVTSFQKSKVRKRTVSNHLHYHMSLGHVPFILGTYTGPSHSVVAGIQSIIGTMKSHNGLCSKILKENNSKQIKNKNDDIINALRKDFNKLTLEHEQLKAKLSHNNHQSKELVQKYKNVSELLDAKAKEIIYWHARSQCDKEEKSESRRTKSEPIVPYWKPVKN